MPLAIDVHDLVKRYGKRTVVDHVSLGIEQGRIRSDIDVRMFYRLVRDAVAGSIRWFKPTKSKTIEDIADEVMDFLLNGILVKA